MPRRLTASILAAAAGATALASDPTPPAPAPFTPEITAEQVLTRVVHLAADAMDGRESGTEGGRKTEEWVAAEMKRMGLEPLSASPGSPFTEVPMTGRPVPEESWIEIAAEGKPAQRVGGAEGAVPFSFSSPQEAAGPLVFAGFGITSASPAYDDYAGADVKGKVVLVLRHGPGEKDPQSPWSSPQRRMRELAFSAKARRAADAGASAILLVNDIHHEDDGLPVDAAGEDSPIPVFAIKRATADALLAPLGKSLADLQRAIDEHRTPRTQPVPGVSVRVHATIVGEAARNVVFVRRGSDPALAGEAVLVCAHMDHVGRGFFGSVSKSAGQIHNGADDNASGTAALLEVAEAIAAGPATKRSIVFAAWCGEEKGLVGSRHFVASPLWDLSKIALCVNLDMVGRYREKTGLLMCGMPTALGTEERVTRLAAAHALEVRSSWEAWEQSDHYAFYLKGVPSLFAHTGLHLDYHRPSDDWWTVETGPAARIARLVADLAREVADAADRPVFVKKPPRPVLGVRLADADGGAGAKILAVVPGLGANAAGLQVGDVVTRFGGVEIKDAATLSAQIQACKAGDAVDVVYLRGAVQRTAKVRVSGL